MNSKSVSTDKIIFLSILLIFGFLLYGACVSAAIDVSVISPESDVSTNDPTPNFVFNVTGNFSDYECNLTVDGSAYGTNSTSLNSSLTTITANHTIPEGTFDWYVICTDAEEESSIPLTKSITIDTIGPVISLDVATSMISGNYSSDTIYENITAEDAGVGLDMIIVRLYNETGIINTTESTTSPFFLLYTPLVDGLYYLNATANDTLGNSEDTTTLVIRLDNAAPTTTDNAPSTWQNVDVVVNLTASDTDGSGVAYTTYILDGTAHNGTSVNVNTSGNHSLVYYSVDKASNSESSHTKYVLVDKTAPVVTLHNPAASGFVTSASTNFNFTATDLFSSNMNCTIYINGTSTFVMLATNGSATNKTLDLDSGSYTWYVNCSDHVSNYNVSATRGFTVDTTDPIITFTSAPASDSMIGTVSFPYNLTGTIEDTDSSINMTRFYKNGTSAANVTNVNLTAQSWSYVWTNPGTGVYDISVETCDNAGLCKNVSRTNITVDGNGPTIVLSSPTNKTYNDSSISLNFSATDIADISACWYNINSTTANVTVSNCSSGINNSITLYLASAHYNVTVYANDSFGNLKSSWQIFIINDTIAPTISGASPSGSQSYSVSVTLSVTTSEDATCRYSKTSTNYSTMTNFTDDITAHTSSYGVSASTSYSILVICRDMSNNEKNTTLSFSIASTSSSGNHNNGGGGGGTLLNDYSTGLLSDTVSLSYSQLPKGDKTITVNNMLLSEIALSMIGNSSNVKFVVTRSNSHASPYSGGKVYVYLTVDHQNLENAAISKAVLKFKVEKSWIINNSLSNADIVLVRYDSAAWKELVTTVLSEDSNYVYYSAQSPGLSSFVIATKSTTAPLPVVTAAKPNTTTPSNATVIGSAGTKAIKNTTSQTIGVNVNEGAGSTTSTTKGSSIFVWVIVIIVIVAVLMWFGYSKKKRKKSKEEMNSQNLAALYDKYGVENKKTDTTEPKTAANPDAAQSKTPVSHNKHPGHKK